MINPFENKSNNGPTTNDVTLLFGLDCNYITRGFDNIPASRFKNILPSNKFKCSKCVSCKFCLLIFSVHFKYSSARRPQIYKQKICGHPLSIEQSYKIFFQKHRHCHIERTYQLIFQQRGFTPITSPKIVSKVTSTLDQFYAVKSTNLYNFNGEFSKYPLQQLDLFLNVYVTCFETEVSGSEQVHYVTLQYVNY